MFRYRIDESLLPLVVFDSPGSLLLSRIDQDSFYAEVERILARRVPFATLHDLRGTEPDAARRKRFSSWTQKNFDVLAPPAEAWLRSELDARSKRASVDVK